MDEEPDRPARDWKVIDRGYDFGAGSIACPSAHLCVAIDEPWPGGDVFTSINPARGRWRIGRLGVSDLERLSCPSVHLCVAVGPSTVAVSTNPAGGAGTWRISTEPALTFGMGGALSVGPLTCASVRLCVATNGDLVFATANPAQGATAWSSSDLNQGYNPLTAIACPSEQFCVGIDGAGNLITSSALSAIPTAWSVAPLGIGL